MKQTTTSIRIGRWLAVTSCAVLMQTGTCFLGDDFVPNAALLTYNAILDSLVIENTIELIDEKQNPLLGPADIPPIDDVRSRPSSGIVSTGF